MGTIVDKFNYSFEAKDLIKDSINNLGGSITSETELKEYAEELDNIYTNLPKTTGENSNLSLTTLKGKMNIIPKGDTQQAILPSTYQQVEYIEGTGIQYITTNYKLTSNNAQIKTKVYIPEMINTENDIIGNQDSASGRFVIGMFNKTIFGYSKSLDTQDPNVQSATLSGSQTLEIDLTYNSTTHKKTLKVNGTSTEATYNSSIISTKAIQIFANGENNNSFTGRVYYVEVYDNGTLKLHLIPCYRVSDNVIGMYDLVSNTFYAGSGTFTKGNNAPTPDTPIDVEVVKGTQEVKVENVNLLKLANGTYTSGNVSAVVNNGIITLNGTSGSSVSTIAIPFATTLNGEYTLSANNEAIGTTMSSSGWVGMRLKASSSSTISSSQMAFAEANATTTFTLTNQSVQYFDLRIGASITFTNYIIKPQLEYGSTATTYTPHQEQTQVVELSSKNLVDFSNLITSGTSTTYTFTNDTSTISNTSGTYNNVSIELVDMVKANAGKTLKFVCEQADFSNTKTNSEASNVVQLKVVNNGTTSYNGLLKKDLTSATYTIPSDTTNITSAVLQMSSNNTATSQSASTTIIKPMLIFNGESETYEEYYNYELCKIGTYQDYMYKTSGKNLFCGYDNMQVGFLPASGEYPTSNPAYINARYQLIELKTGESITLSGSTSEYGRVRYIDTDTNEVVGAVSILANEYFTSTADYYTGFTNGTITAKKNVIIGIMVLAPHDTFTKLMINEGTTALTYEPYGSGNWYKKKYIPKVQLTSSMTWNSGGGATGVTRYYTTAIQGNVVTPANNETLAQAYSNIGVVTATQTYNGSKLGVAIHPNGSIYIDSSIKDSLANKEVWLYYVYSTPQDIQITNETLIEQLNNLEEMKSYNGTTNINCSGNLSAILGVSAIKGE